MRSRSRTVTQSVPSLLHKKTHVKLVDGLWVQDYVENLDVDLSGSTFNLRTETIQDTLGYGASQPCIHTKEGFRPAGAVNWFHSYRGYPSSSLGADSDITLPGITDIFLTLGSNPSSIPIIGDVPELVFESIDIDLAYRGLMAQLRASPNGFFGFEFLTDLVRLYSSVSRPWKPTSLNRISSILRKFSLSSKGTLGGIRKALLSTSNGYLAWNFGVKPLVSDFRMILSASQSVNARLEHLNRFKDRLVPVAHRFPVSSIVYNESPAPPNSGPLLYRKLISDIQFGTMSGKARFRPGFSGYTASQVTADYFRLGDLAGTAWELIPMSFVVDWFFHVDKRIEGFNSSGLLQYGPYASLEEINISSKLERIFAVYKHYHTDSPFGPNDSPQGEVRIGDYYISEYRRNYLLDRRSDSLDYRNMDAFKLITSGALAIQRVLR